MPVMAVSLVLISAFLHASWNFLSKRADGGLPFIWLFTAIGTVVYTPVVGYLFLFTESRVNLNHILFIMGSIGLHLIYLVVLQKGYQKGDFSLIYPVARGSAPIMVTIAGILLFHEQPASTTLIGTVIIVGSVFMLTGGWRIFRDSQAALAVAHGFLVAVIIASYTLWDTYVVSFLLLSPLLLDYFTNLGRLLLLTPFAVRRWADIRREWSVHRYEAIGVGIFYSLAYILVLSALAISPLSYVAPLREISILIGTVFGVSFLREEYGKRRVMAAACMVIGVMIIVIG